jgi:hypothetical protein
LNSSLWAFRRSSTAFHTCSCQPRRYPEHLSVTASSPRGKMVHSMEVISAEMLTSNVKHLVLGRDYNFKFKPGQWYVPCSMFTGN